MESTALGVTLFGMMWGWRRADRKERREIRENALAQQDAQHKENTQKLDLLLHENLERPNHLHVDEENQVLNEKNIRYKPGTKLAR